MTAYFFFHLISPFNAVGRFFQETLYQKISSSLVICGNLYAKKKFFIHESFLVSLDEQLLQTNKIRFPLLVLSQSEEGSCTSELSPNLSGVSHARNLKRLFSFHFEKGSKRCCHVETRGHSWQDLSLLMTLNIDLKPGLTQPASSNGHTENSSMIN